MRSYIIRGFLPWLLFFGFADGSLLGLKMASVGALLCLLFFNWRALKQGFLFDILSFAFFVLMWILGVGLHQTIIMKYSLLIGYFSLSLFALLSLLFRVPFALLYARMSVDSIYWKNPLFLKVTYLITLIWSFVFLAATMTAALFYLGGMGTKLWMLQILPVSFIILGIIFTVVFPDYFHGKVVNKEGVATLPGISPIQSIKIGTLLIAYRMLGQGPLLVLVPGAYMNMHTWDPDFLKKLSRTYQLLIFDYPGVGYSKIENSLSFTVENLSELTHHLLASLNLKPKAMLGFSMGAFIALEYAIQYTNELEAIILIGASVGGEKAPQCGDTTKKLCGNKIKYSDLEAMIRWYELLFPRAARERLINKMEKIAMATRWAGGVSSKILQTESNLINDWYKGEGLEKPLENIVMPALIIAGKQDAMVPYENAQILNKVLKNSSIVTYDDAGHGVLFQYPNDVADNIREFLSKLP